jgi:hypothetical protein
MNFSKQEFDRILEEAKSNFRILLTDHIETITLLGGTIMLLVAISWYALK